MEIERKFTLKSVPSNLADFPSRRIVQGYLSTDPVVRVRQDGNEYYLTYKGKGVLSHEEYNLPLNEASFAHLLPKCDGNLISKTRCLIPILRPSFRPDVRTITAADTTGVPVAPDGKDVRLTIELDVFDAPFAGLIFAEVEFPTESAALAFQMPDWFAEDVTGDTHFSNSWLSRISPEKFDFSALSGISG